MTTQHDLDRELNAFLRAGPEELPYESFDAVRDRTEQTRQRAFIGPWRTPIMNKLVTYGLGAAAVVVLIFAGSQFFGWGGGLFGAEPTPTATPEATLEATPSPSAWAGLPAGPFLITGDDGPKDGGSVQVTVGIASSRWQPYSDFDAVIKNDDGLDPPESVGVALLAWAFPADTGFNVYGDPCPWTTTIPQTPATTPDEIAAALAAQASRDASTPVDVTVGGYAGKAITLSVPMSYHQQPDVSREEEFGECDNSTFATYGIESDESVDARNAQGPGQIDAMWILDVDGSIVILDAAYGPTTPIDVVDELRTLAESATFETP